MYKYEIKTGKYSKYFKIKILSDNIWILDEIYDQQDEKYINIVLKQEHSINFLNPK